MCGRRKLPIRWLALICVFLWSSLFVDRASAQYVPPQELTIAIYELTPGGGLTSPAVACTTGSIVYGCTAVAGNADYSYPYDESRITISMEQDYLLDVIPQEMSPWQFDIQALKAQAAAARSYAYHRDRFPLSSNEPNWYNNSNSYQVFLPWKFDSIGGLDVSDLFPCSSFFLSVPQSRVCRAATELDFMLYRYFGAEEPPFIEHPIFAEFSADVLTPGFTEDSAPIVDENGDVLYPRQFPYLRMTSDPISHDPVVPPDDLVFHGRGMSQNGAGRWATGNDAFPTGTDSWGVKLDSTQILAHYYSGIDFYKLNSVSPITPTWQTQPDDRWIPLQMSWSNPNVNTGNLHEFNTASTYPMTISIQNAGRDTWACDAIIEYRLRYSWVSSAHSEDGPTSASLCNLERAELVGRSLTIHTPSVDGIYNLHFDIHQIYLPTGITLSKFSDPDTNGNGWDTHDLLSRVGTPTDSIYMPFLIKQASRSSEVIPTQVALLDVEQHTSSTSVVYFTLLLLALLTVTKFWKNLI